MAKTLERCQLKRYPFPVRAAAQQFDLITDDARREADGPGAISEFKRFRALQKEHGNLLTVSQAARILDVSSSQVSAWVGRQRFTSFTCIGAKMIPAAEVIALYRERTNEGIRSGGRNSKAPSLAEMAKLMWTDLDAGDF